jgi:hypothetical protein
MSALSAFGVRLQEAAAVKRLARFTRARTIVALLAAGALVAIVAASASPALAQGKKKGKPGRDAAMHDCIEKAQREYPDADKMQSPRVAAYKACMTRAGYAP